MKQIEAAFFLSVLLLGCAVERNSGVALSLTAVETAVSKTNTLTVGDEIGVFAAVAGTERYFLDNTQYIVEADGRSLSTTPAVYYPEAKQAINFYAYLPFGGTWSGGVGTFSVPSDQTAALKQADLCWAKASSTPVATPVPLEFRHQMARLLITTNTPTEKIAIPNACLGGTLDIKTGAFTNTLRSEVFTTGTELIVPAQPLTRLLLTVSGVEYTFEGAILLESAKTTSISLTFNPTTKTATLSGSSTTDWSSSTASGSTAPSAHNLLTLHWPNVSSVASMVDRVVFSILDKTTGLTTENTISTGIAYSNGVFVVPFSSSMVHYPYEIIKVRYFNQANEVLPETSLLAGALIYKSGDQTLAVKRNPDNPPSLSDYVVIDGLKWAKGYLVATSSVASGVNGCKIGNPEDGGIYFQFGSLIGWKGGAVASGGTGVGALSHPDGTFWIGSSFVWSNEAIVWPTAMVRTPVSWPSATTGVHQWYFSDRNVTSGEMTASDPTIGLGDPCSYYLGGEWRMPTRSEATILRSNPFAKQGLVGASYGCWVGPSPGNPSSSIFFAAWHQRWIGGAFNRGSSWGPIVSWSTATISGTDARWMIYYVWHLGYFIEENIAGSWGDRTVAYPVRCVSI